MPAKHIHACAMRERALDEHGGRGRTRLSGGDTDEEASGTCTGWARAGRFVDEDDGMK